MVQVNQQVKVMEKQQIFLMQRQRVCLIMRLIHSHSQQEEAIQQAVRIQTRIPIQQMNPNQMETHIQQAHRMG